MKANISWTKNNSVWKPIIQELKIIEYEGQYFKKIIEYESQHFMN